MACAARAPPGPGEAQEGFAQLEVAVPSQLDNPLVRAREAAMSGGLGAARQSATKVTSGVAVAPGKAGHSPSTSAPRPNEVVPGLVEVEVAVPRLTAALR